MEFPRFTDVLSHRSCHFESAHKVPAQTVMAVDNAIYAADLRLFWISSALSPKLSFNRLRAVRALKRS